ncbi:hypothetical protein GQ42DRAFT_158309 [Ramicandelaber brevisporus]|nr:hypothetical protein GQ42DRAFT_158309 [Ramicandelaber brevisporus]
MSDFLAGSAVLDLADRFFGTHDTDWVAAMDQGMAKLEKMKKPQPPVAKGTKPSRPLDSYAGSYLHKGAGTIKISVAASNQTAPLNAHLPGKANTEPCPLAHKQYDSFECSADGYVIPVSFIASDASSQTFDKINVQFEPAVMETLFTRV